MTQIKTLIFLYRYTFYALLKNAFGERVRMLYTDIDSFLLHFLVEDLAKEINARPYLRDAFDFSEIIMGTFITLYVVMLIYTAEKWATSRMRPRAIRSSSS